MKNLWKAAASAILLAVLIIPLFSTPSIGQELTAREIQPIEGGIPHEITRGKTREFGGGEFIKINIGKSNTLMFIWGNRDIKAPITVVTSGVEIVGHQSFSNGTIKPISTEVITVYRLESLIEFEDANKNGFYDPGRTLSTVDAENDRILKTLSLSLAWSFQHRPPRQTKDGLQWEFALEARNISYTRTTTSSVRPTATADRASNFVEAIRFVFHLTASKNKETRLIMEMNDGSSLSADSAGSTGARYDLERMNVTTKMDHHINGWDFSSDNKRPFLMLKFNLHMGRTFDRGIIDRITDPKRSELFGDPSIGIEYSDQARRTVWDEFRDRPLLNSVDASGEGDIGMENSRTLLSRYFWNDRLLELNPDGGRSLRSNLQVFNVSYIGPFAEIWKHTFFGSRLGAGISVFGAHIYPRALNIHHDPGIQTFGWSMLEKHEPDGPDRIQVIPGVTLTKGEASVLIVIFVLVLLVAVAIILSLTRRRLYPGDEELWKEEEEEVFVVKAKKRDWDKLRPK